MDKWQYLGNLEFLEGVRGIDESHIHAKTVESLIVIILSMALVALLTSGRRSRGGGKLFGG
jgi:hypothetical protein